MTRASDENKWIRFQLSMLEKNNSQEWGICKNNAVISVRADINFSFRQIIYLKIKSVGKSFPEMFPFCNFHFFFYISDRTVKALV